MKPVRVVALIGLSLLAFEPSLIQAAGPRVKPVFVSDITAVTISGFTPGPGGSNTTMTFTPYDALTDSPGFGVAYLSAEPGIPFGFFGDGFVYSPTRALAVTIRCNGSYSVRKAAATIVFNGGQSMVIKFPSTNNIGPSGVTWYVGSDGRLYGSAAQLGLP